MGLLYSIHDQMCWRKTFFEESLLDIFNDGSKSDGSPNQCH